MVAVSLCGLICTSSDSEVTWTKRYDNSSKVFAHVACDSSCTKAVTVTSPPFSTGHIFTSNDSGLTWTQQNGAGGNWW